MNHQSNHRWSRSILAKDSYSYTSVSTNTDVFASIPCTSASATAAHELSSSFLNQRSVRSLFHYAASSLAQVGTSVLTKIQIPNCGNRSVNETGAPAKAQHCTEKPSSLFISSLGFDAKCFLAIQTCFRWTRSDHTIHNILRFGTASLLTLLLIVMLLFWTFLVFDLPKTRLVEVTVILIGKNFSLIEIHLHYIYIT